MILFLTIILCLHAKINALNVENIPFKQNPGLYFEPVTNVHLKSAEWQIVIYIDIEEYFKAHESANYSFICYQEPFKANATEIARCWSSLGLGFLQMREKEITDLHEQIRETAKNIGTPENDEDNLQLSTIRKPRVPLAFLGSWGRSLFGTLTLEDAEIINGNIDKLFQDQQEMIHLNKDQTHIISGRLQEISNTTKKHQLALRKLHLDVDNAIDTLNKERIHYELSEYGRLVGDQQTLLIRNAEKTL